MIATVALDRTPTTAPSKAEAPLRAVHTPNFPGPMRRLGDPLLAITYQAGNLVMVCDESAVSMTHFRAFAAPMGLALRGDRPALGASVQACESRNAPDMAVKLDPRGGHDACFLPRRYHITGDAQVEGMAPGGDDCWLVNTRFSRLSTLDPSRNIVPTAIWDVAARPCRTILAPIWMNSSGSMTGLQVYTDRMPLLPSMSPALRGPASNILVDSQSLRASVRRHVRRHRSSLVSPRWLRSMTEAPNDS
jgi:hypothetical protein